MLHSHITSLPRETILHICGFLWNPWCSTQPSLASLAVTCSSFSDPALDVLWNTVYGLALLLLFTLPKDLSLAVPPSGEVDEDEEDKEEEDPTTPHQIVFIREPNLQDFTRFSRYARRIKTYNGRGAAHVRKYTIHPDVWAKLLLHGPKNMFSNLRTVEHAEAECLLAQGCCILPAFTVRPTELFLGPNLKTVSFMVGHESSGTPRINQVIKSLCSSSPHIRSLDVTPELCFHTTCLRPLESVPLSCPELTQFIHLREFGGYGTLLAPGSLMALSTLPHLQKLRVRVKTAEFEWETLPHSKDNGSFFGSLTELSVSGDSCEWLIAFLRIITSTTLKELSFNQCHHDRWAYRQDLPPVPNILFQMLCAAIGQHPSWQHTIGIVDIEVVVPDLEMSHPGDLYTSQHIAPLLPLTALRRLSICTKPCQVILDDAMLNAIARAWPRIEGLRLSCLLPKFQGAPSRYPQLGDPTYPVATLAGILLLARHCLYLTELCLAVDMRIVPELGGLGRPPVSVRPGGEHPLIAFDTQGSVFPVGGALALAPFFSLVFPRLSGGGSFDNTMWRDMIGLFSRFRSIRVQERRWALENVGQS